MACSINGVWASSGLHTGRKHRTGDVIGPKRRSTVSKRTSNQSISSEQSSIACSRLAALHLRADLPARNPPDVGQTIMVRIDPEAVTLISEH